MYDVRRLFNSPGRFFAANEVKALLAHLLMMYDMKLEIGKSTRIPRQFRLGSRYIPRNANLLFRKRQR
jgi:hypothetical protein